MQYIIDATRTKTLCFERHRIIDDTLWKMKAIYNPIKRFAVQFIPGYDPLRGHETTPFNMNYHEYRQRELYLLLNDIFWITQEIKTKFIVCCMMYKRLNLLICIVSKSSKIIQRWAIVHDLYIWHESYWTILQIKTNSLFIQTQKHFYFFKIHMKSWEIAYNVTIILIVNTLSGNTTVKMRL